MASLPLYLLFLSQECTSSQPCPMKVLIRVLPHSFWIVLLGSSGQTFSLLSPEIPRLSAPVSVNSPFTPLPPSHYFGNSSLSSGIPVGVTPSRKPSQISPPTPPPLACVSPSSVLSPTVPCAHPLLPHSTDLVCFLVCLLRLIVSI